MGSAKIQAAYRSAGAPRRLIETGPPTHPPLRSLLCPYSFTDEYRQERKDFRLTEQYEALVSVFGLTTRAKSCKTPKTAQAMANSTMMNLLITTLTDVSYANWLSLQLAFSLFRAHQIISQKIDVNRERPLKLGKPKFINPSTLTFPERDNLRKLKFTGMIPTVLVVSGLSANTGRDSLQLVKDLCESDFEGSVIVTFTGCDPRDAVNEYLPIQFNTSAFIQSV